MIYGIGIASIVSAIYLAWYKYYYNRNVIEVVENEDICWEEILP